MGAVQCGCSAVWVQILISCVLQVKEMDEARRAVLLIDATYEVRAHNGSCYSERSQYLLSTGAGAAVLRLELPIEAIVLKSGHKRGVSVP